MDSTKLTIEYCAPCNYLPRAVWQVQELMPHLAGSVQSVELIPGGDGCYRVTLGDRLLFNKKDEGRFPEPNELLEAAHAALAQDA